MCCPMAVSAVASRATVGDPKSHNKGFTDILYPTSAPDAQDAWGNEWLALALYALNVLVQQGVCVLSFKSAAF